MGSRLTINYSIEGVPVYPHLKLTREEFPRLLATRIIKVDGDEYFGAFLTKTSVRILIDFFNRVFRLRSCDIEIDGSFPAPCTQYFAKRCVAPCVAEICSRRRHREIADLLRLFLKNQRGELKEQLMLRIEAASAELDFEGAAKWRDILHNVEYFWSKPRWRVWLDDTVDTYGVDETACTVNVRLVTQRAGKMLGSWEHAFGRIPDVSAIEAVGDVIRQFYRFHAPREIRVPADFSGRRELAVELSERFGRKVDVRIVRRALPPTTVRAFEKAGTRHALRELVPKVEVTNLQRQLQFEFGLDELPTRVEAFDVAHISATAFAGAMCVWEEGELRRDEYRHWLSDETDELATMRAILQTRFAQVPADLPDLVLIDGGQSQLKAAVQAISAIRDRKIVFISAVKPRGKHRAVSHFLTEDGRRVEFDPKSDTHRLLQSLRDEAHELSNSVHRRSRDMLHFYERRGLEPLIVPIRFDEEGGHADDLRPIVTR